MIKKVLKTKENNGRGRKGVMRHVDIEFAKLLDEIKRTRIILGQDEPNKISADWRISLAFIRHPLTQKIKEDIINAVLE